MFTGIVQSVGAVKGFQRVGSGARLTVDTGLPEKTLKLGDSIAVDGCCQTIAALDGAVCVFDCLAETLNRTNFRDYRTGRLVNIEPALAVGDRLGGHIVQGHVDAAMHVMEIKRRGGDLALTVRRPDRSSFPMVQKGSIAINGVSLTVAELTEESFTVCIIPHTWAATSLKALNAGDCVNLEADLVGKYIAELCRNSAPSITMEGLKSAGF
ncbi:MAG: riboflavin synthase [Lentisphaeria bacterium]|nr:riboflavin synthase [Lentisphaeria bacterium]